MGIIDLAFNKKSTHLSVSYMDSTIKIYDLHTCTSTITQLSLQTSSAR
jgi:hypothetical protein